jgi:hypothetical protein
MNNKLKRVLLPGWRAGIVSLISFYYCQSTQAPAQDVPNPAPPIPAIPAPQIDLVMRGDVLEISVDEHASFNGRYQVRHGGYIIIPAVGRVSIAGKTLEEARAVVRSALEAEQLPHATVTLKKVKDPGVEPLPSSSNAGRSSGPSAGSIYVTGRVANP